MEKNDKARILSIASTAVTFIASAIMFLYVIFMDKSGAGITNSQFTPVKITMFASGIPALVKFYISSRDTGEGKPFIWIHGLCLAMWLIFLIMAFSGPYFANIRTSVITSNILVAIGLYIEVSMVNKKWVK